VVTDLPMAAVIYVILNVDADEPGSAPEIITGIRYVYFREVLQGYNEVSVGIP